MFSDISAETWAAIDACHGCRFVRWVCAHASGSLRALMLREILRCCGIRIRNCGSHPLVCGLAPLHTCQCCWKCQVLLRTRTTAKRTLHQFDKRELSITLSIALSQALGIIRNKHVPRKQLATHMSILIRGLCQPSRQSAH